MGKVKQLIEERPEDLARKPHKSPGTKDHRETPDPVPMAPPVGYKKQESIFDQMRKLIHDERIKQQLAESGMETFDEADDLEIEDDIDPSSPYENNFEPNEQDRAAILRTPISADDPQLQQLVRGNRSKAQQPGEGAGGLTPDDPPAPSGFQRVTSYIRKTPGKEPTPGERQ